MLRVQASDLGLPASGGVGFQLRRAQARWVNHVQQFRWLRLPVDVVSAKLPEPPTRDGSGDGGRSTCAVFVLPESQHTPSKRLETLHGVEVTLPVCFELCPPPICIGLWPSGVSRAAVPEATVNEHRNSGLGEGQIRAATGLWERPVHTKPESASMHGRPDRQFAPGIAPLGAAHSGKRRV